MVFLRDAASPYLHIARRLGILGSTFHGNGLKWVLLSLSPKTTLFLLPGSNKEGYLLSRIDHQFSETCRMDMKY
jgi:hypothetical protein